MIKLEQIGAPAFTLAVCADGRFRYLEVNAASIARTGLALADVAGKTPEDLQDPDTAAWLCSQYRMAAAGRLTEYDTKLTVASGDIWWRTSLTPIKADDGSIGMLLGVCQDISSEKQMEADLTAKNHQLDMAIRMLHGATWRFDARTGRFEASPNFALLLGEDCPRPLEWDEWAERVLVEDRARAACSLALAKGPGESTVDFRFRNNAGLVRWARCQRAVTADQAGHLSVCGVVVDVTADRERADELEQQAAHDSLTGLLNRRGFKQAMNRFGTSSGAALLMIDLDRFKPVNDTFGHAAGDAVLSAVAKRLAAAVGETAIVARMGGDEFVVVARAATAVAAQEIRQRVNEAVTFRLSWEKAAISVAASVGCAWSLGGSDPSMLLGDADADLYRNKRDRKAAAPSVERVFHDRALHAA